MKSSQIYINNGTDYFEMTLELLKAADIAGNIGDRNKKIGIKPNLVIAAKADGGATTHPEIVDAVLTYFQDEGFTDLAVMEGSWVGARTGEAVRVSGIAGVCAKHGVEFVDLQKDSSSECDAHGMSIRVCTRAQELDYLINLPVLKGHCQTEMTCALKNAKGLIPNSEKRNFHSLGLHKPIAHLNTCIPEQFIIVDNICGDLDFEEGGNPVSMNRILLCKDPVLCDSFACSTMGIDISEVPYIEMAESLGVGSSDLSKAEIISLNSGEATPAVFPMTRRIRELSDYAAPVDACSACYGMLIHALDRMRQNGDLDSGKAKICIGQGYKGTAEGEIGIGNCTRGCLHSLEGCPPSADSILDFLYENW